MDAVVGKTSGGAVVEDQIKTDDKQDTSQQDTTKPAMNHVPRAYFKQLGDWGKFQAYVYFLSLIPHIISGVVLVQNVFTLGAAPHRCLVAGCDSPTVPNFSEAWLDEVSRSERCLLRRGDNLSVATNATGQQVCVGSFFNETINCPSGFVYDFTAFPMTAVSEFNLVCDKEVQATVSFAIFHVGMLFSAIICGYCSDRFGRRSIYWWTPAIGLAGSLITAFAPNIVVYTLGSFLLAFALYGMVIVSFVIGVEFVGKKYRLICGNGYPVAFAIGECLLAVAFYFLGNWRQVQAAIAISLFLMLFYPLLLPESIRWQVAHSRDAEALKTLHTAAKYNNIILREPTELEMKLANQTRKEPAKVFDVFRHPILVRWIVNLCLAWFVCSLSYYGLTQATSSIAGGLNFYVAFILISLVEIPFIFLLTFAMRYIGRRVLFSGCLLATSVACLLAIPFPNSRLVFGILAKGFVSGAFSLSYIYTAEVFPTAMRNFGLGFCSFFARIGGIASPFVAASRFMGPISPLVICGVLCVISGILVIDLPETKGRELPETIEEIEHYKRKSKRSIPNPVKIYARQYPETISYD